MRSAIVHYHLNRGGVTQVVVNHVLALDAAGRQALDFVLLVHGGQRAGFPEDLPEQLRGIRVREAVVPELAYDEVAGGGPRPRVLADRIESVLRQSGCDAANTVLHVHNHALGKNLSLPGALGALARDGYAMLLQVHDFAEDFRPANYRRLRMALSPDAPDRLP
ncbi:MAG: hypothetical protein FJ276_26680, partial [Planctomycetes bacterium]|nr:hypothetical protein [Planctomycetota bacterium]